MPPRGTKRSPVQESELGKLLALAGHVDGRFDRGCPLLALSGLSDALITRSGFSPKADMPNEHVECPPMTRGGRSPLVPRQPVTNI